MTDVRHTAGQQGEEHAAQHFERLGFDVLARNHRTRFGELDLVAYDGATLVFVEVKTRRSATRARGRTSTTASTRRSAGWRSPGSPSAPATARLRRATCASTASASSLDARRRLVRLDHLEAAF